MNRRSFIGRAVAAASALVAGPAAAAKLAGRSAAAPAVTGAATAFWTQTTRVHLYTNEEYVKAVTELTENPEVFQTPFGDIEGREWKYFPNKDHA